MFNAQRIERARSSTSVGVTEHLSKGNSTCNMFWVARSSKEQITRVLLWYILIPALASQPSPEKPLIQIKCLL